MTPDSSSLAGRDNAESHPGFVVVWTDAEDKRLRDASSGNLAGFGGPPAREGEVAEV
jgi:hypothetical protein